MLDPGLSFKDTEIDKREIDPKPALIKAGRGFTKSVQWWDDDSGTSDESINKVIVYALIFAAVIIVCLFTISLIFGNINNRVNINQEYTMEQLQPKSNPGIINNIPKNTIIVEFEGNNYLYDEDTKEMRLLLNVTKE